MLRQTTLSLAFLAIPWVAEGQFHALSKGVDINNAVNVSQFVLIDWTNTGKTNVVAIDPLKRQLVLSTAGQTWLSWLKPAEVLAQEVPHNSKLLVADIDPHKGNELLLLSGNRVQAWTSGQRLTPSSSGPDLTFQLPVEFTWATDASIADFDQDGSPDLLVTEAYDIEGRHLIHPAHVVFSLGKPGQSVVELPTLPGGWTKIAPAWQVGGAPSLVTTGDNGLTRVSRFSQQREWIEITNYTGGGYLAELDGVGPPERVTLTYADTFPPDSIVTIERHDGINWQLTHTFPLGQEELSYWNQSVCAVDFEGDGRQELMITVAESLSGFFPQSYAIWMLAEDSPGNGLGLTRLRSLPGYSFSTGAVGNAASPGQGLAMIHSSTPTYDLFGNPVSISGTGMRGMFMTYTAGHGAIESKILAPTIPEIVAYGPFDNHADSDLLVVNGNSPSNFYRGPFITEPTTSSSNPSWPGGNDIVSHLTADMNGDGRIDFIVSEEKSVQTVLSGNFELGGQFGQSSKIPFTLTGNNSKAPTQLLGVADFDLDGDIDPLILNGRDEVLSWLDNVNGGDLANEHVISLAGRISQSPSDRLVGKDQTIILDADQDGDPDILTLPSALGNRLCLHRNTGSGQFSLEALALRLEDLIGPGGYPDQLLTFRKGHFLSSSDPIQLAVITRSFDSNYRTFVSFVWGVPGSLNVSQRTEIPHLISAIVTDFDGDGLGDLISYDGMGTDLFGNPIGSTQIRFHRSRGDGTIDPAVVIASPQGFISDLIATDYNKDGMMDLISTSKETGTVEMFSHQMIAQLPTYEAWLESHDLTGSGASDDPDYDGKANLMEYVTGQDPHGAASPPGAPSSAYADLSYPGSTFLWASHPRPRTAGEPQWKIILEASTDLKNWIQAEEPSVQVDPLNPQWETLRWNSASFDMGEHTSFFHRFRVERATAR